MARFFTDPKGSVLDGLVLKVLVTRRCSRIARCGIELNEGPRSYRADEVRHASRFVEL